MHQQGQKEGAVLIERYLSDRPQVFISCVLVVLCAVPTLFASEAAQEKTGPAQPANKIRILVLTDATKPLTVHYESKGRITRSLILNEALMGLAPVLIDAEATSHEQSKESMLLQNNVGPFERRLPIEAGLAAMFKASTQYFEAVIPLDPSAYIAGTTINLNKAQADGYPYVLSLREKFAGLATVAGLGTLSAGSSMEFKLTDAATGKELGKGKTSAFGARKQDFDTATSDRSAFVADYAAAVANECGQIYGQLNKGGQLHAMAEVHGLGKEVPDIGFLLAKYEKLFDYDLAVPKGWSQAKVSKYQVVLEPKNSDKAKFGVNFTVDLLVEEFGQKVDDVTDYIRIYFGRLQDLGYAVDTATSFDRLTLTPPYTGFLIDRPKGAGKEVFLFRLVDGPFVVTYDIVLLDDYEGFLKKYDPDVESLINQSRITTHQ